MSTIKRFFYSSLICLLILASSYWLNISNSTLAASLPAPNHSILFGYYHVSAQYGDFSNDVKSYTNTAIILEGSFLRSDGTNEIEAFKNAFNKAVANNQQIVFAPEGLSGDLVDRGLEVARPFWDRIALIYLSDEPSWDKTTTENNINSFKNILTAKGLAQKQIAINYTNQQIMTGSSFQASNLDIIGFEAYIDVSQQNSSNLVSSLNTQIDQAKAKIGNKKMFIVIQGYDRNGTWTNRNSLQSIQVLPYLKAYNDPNVMGLFVFTYARSGGTKDLGTCIATEHKRIWAAISGTAQPTPVSCESEVTATELSVDATAGWGGQLAYNPKKNNWLVVSGGTGQISGRIMGNDRVPATPEFKIDTDAGGQVMAPKVAYAEDINKYMVVWISFTSGIPSITGRFVNEEGTFSGAPFVIFKDPGLNSFLYSNSILRYDARNKKFVFVWEFRNPAIEVNLITVNQSGVPGPVIKISTGANGGSWSPSLAINENANEYCVAFDQRNDGKLAVRKVNAVTGALGAETTINTVGLYTSIVYNSVDNKYLIGWEATSPLVSQGRILNSCNITDSSSGTITLNSAGRTLSVAYNPKSNNYAVIVQDQNDFGNTYNILSPTGVKLKEGVAFAGSRNGSGGNFYPVIAPNLNDGTFAATSAVDYATTRFASNLGTRTGGVPITNPTPPVEVTDGSQQSMAFNPTGNNWMVVSFGNNQLQSRLVSNDGVLLTEKNIVNTRGSGGIKIIFAQDLNKFLVLWAENPTTSSSITYGRFLSPSNINDGEIFEIDRGFLEWSSFNNNDRLQYDFTNKKFVVSYRDNIQGIILLTIDASKEITKTVVAKDINEAFYLGQVAINEDKNEYCVNMFSTSSGGPRSQALRSVNALTKNMGQIKKSTRGDGGFITYNTVNKEYLTVYNENGNAYGQALGRECSFTNAKTPFIIQAYARTVSYNPKSNTYAVIAEGSASLSDNPVTIFDHTGKIFARFSPFSSLTDTRIGLFNPMIEANTNDGTFAAITVKDYEVTIFVANIGCDGCQGGNPTSITSPLGALNEVGCDMVRGWAVDLDDYTLSLTVEIFINGPEGTGSRIFSGITDDLRADINSTLGITGIHGFAVATPASIKDGRDHEVWVYAQDTDTFKNVSFANNRKIFNSGSCIPPTIPICDQLIDDPNHILVCNLWGMQNRIFFYELPGWNQ